MTTDKPVRRRRSPGKPIRRERVVIKCTKKEKARLRYGADSEGLTLGAYLVRRGLVGVPEELPQG